MQRWFYDIIIFGFLLGDPFVLAYLSRHGERILGGSINDVLLFLLVLAWPVIFYGSFFEPRKLRIHEETIVLRPDAKRTLRAVMLSDIHVGPYKQDKFIERFVGEIEKIKPDVVFFVGDFVFKKAQEAIHLRPLAQIGKRFPTFAVLGNHDYDLMKPTDPIDEACGDAVKKELQQAGVRVLTNLGEVIADGSLYLAGVDEYWTKRGNIRQALSQRPAPGLPTILLAHNPDFVQHISPADGIDLVLSGHTHGGQVRLPVLGAVPPIPNQLGRAYDAGLLDYHGQRLFVSTGAGESGTRARLFNPPELVVLELHY